MRTFSSVEPAREPLVQANRYKGSPPRPWLRVRLTAPDGQEAEVELIADTGNPFPLIISEQQFETFKHWDGPSANTNFGQLHGGLLRVSVDGLREDLWITSYGSDAVADAARSSDPELCGLVGLPFLQEFRYGGDADEFWIA